MASHRKSTRGLPLVGVAVRLGVTTLNLALVVAALGFAFLAVGPHFGKYRTLTMLSGSMTPAMPTGSAVIEVPVRPSQLRVGDVVTVTLPDPDKPVVTHRIVDISTNKAGVVSFHTKGDANAKEDLWASTVTADKVWVAKAAIPYVGKVTQVFRSRGAHLITAVALPAVVLVLTLHSVWSSGSAPSKPSRKAQRRTQAA